MKIARLMLLFLVSIALGSARAGDGAAQENVSAVVRQDFLQSGEFRIRYWDAGSGEVIVLLHGLFGDADVWWEFDSVAELIQDFRVVALDLRGHGESTKSHDPADYGPRMAEDVVALLDALGVERAHILGYSYGGLVAGELLAQYPDRVTSVILGGSSRQRPNVEADLEWSGSFADALEQDDAVDWLSSALASGDAAADGCGAPRMFAAHQHHQQTEDKSMTPEEIHAAVQALRAEMAATKARKAAERKGGTVRNRVLSEYAADAAYAAEVKPGPYDVALGREINADLDLYDVLLPSTGEPTAELPAPPRPYDEPIRQLRERDRMREAHR